MLFKKSGFKRTESSLSWLSGKMIKIGLKGLPAFVIFAVMWIGVFAMHQMLTKNAYFQVARIKVFPSGVLTAGEYEFLEKVTRGKSLFETDLNLLSRVLERNPRVKSAQIARNFPHEIRVFVTPRQPTMQVQVHAQGPYYLLDDDQIVLAELKRPDQELFIVEDYDAKDKIYLPGQKYRNPYFDDVTHLLEFIKSDPIMRKESVSRGGIDRLGNWSVTLTDGTKIKIGRQFKLSTDKRAVIEAILGSSERRNVLYIDARYRDIVVKKKSILG